MYCYSNLKQGRRKEKAPRSLQQKRAMIYDFMCDEDVGINVKLLHSFYFT